MMTIDWKDVLLTTLLVVVLIYAIEYGVSLWSGHSFQPPPTGAVIAAIVAANLSRRRKKKM